MYLRGIDIPFFSYNSGFGIRVMVALKYELKVFTQEEFTNEAI